MGGWGRAWALILERDLGLVYEQGSEGSKRGHLGLSKAGSKGLFYIKKIPARVAVQRMFQNPGHIALGASLAAGGKGTGRSCAPLTFTVLAVGSGRGHHRVPSVRTGTSHVGRTSALGTQLSRGAHFVTTLCLLEPQPQDLWNRARGHRGASWGVGSPSPVSCFSAAP